MAGILLFGGSFDPVHHGHLIVSRAAAEQLAADRVMLIPSASPPHKQSVRLAGGEHRAAMCRAAVAGDPLFDVSDWELGQAGPNYTLLTVRHFRDVVGERGPVYWLIGRDSLCDLHTWYRVRDLAAACTLVTVGRGVRETPALRELSELLSPEQLQRIRDHVLDTPLIEISATEVRRRVAAGRSIRHLVPDAVREYIAAQGLYLS